MPKERPKRPKLETALALSAALAGTAGIVTGLNAPQNKIAITVADVNTKVQAVLNSTTSTSTKENASDVDRTAPTNPGQRFIATAFSEDEPDVSTDYMLVNLQNKLRKNRLLSEEEENEIENAEKIHKLLIKIASLPSLRRDDMLNEFAEFNGYDDKTKDYKMNRFQHEGKDPVDFLYAMYYQDLIELLRTHAREAQDIPHLFNGYWLARIGMRKQGVQDLVEEICAAVEDEKINRFLQLDKRFYFDLGYIKNMYGVL